MNKFIEGIFPGTLEPDATIAGCVDIFENVWPDPDLTIDRIKYESSIPDSDFKWVKSSTVGNGQYQDHRTNYDMCITSTADLYNNPLAKDLHNQTYFLLLATTLPYIQKYGVQQELHHEYYNLLRYSGGQYYASHYDGSAVNRRVLSAIIYLNNDYDGGEIEFVNFNVKIKPEPGMLILFPSDYAYRHIAHPVKNGEKYAIVTWLYEG